MVTIPWSAPATTRVVTQTVSFKNAGATLHGTLYLPASARRAPAIVVFHGASEPLASTPLYEHLREGLPQIGIAVLLFDRRGTGASTGDPHVSYATLADDGIAGARALRNLPVVDPERVGYWGISQGGWLATFAASRDPQAAFAVAVSAPLVTAESQMEFAMSNQLTVLGYGKSAIDEMLDARHQLDSYYNKRSSRDAAAAALRKIQAEPWFKVMYLPDADSVAKSPAASPARVWRTQMDVDSLAALRRVNVPVLFLLGDSDPWIPVSKTVDMLRALSHAKRNLQYAVVPHANHLMMTPPAREQMNDANPDQVAIDRPQAAAYFMILAQWLQEHVLAR